MVTLRLRIRELASIAGCACAHVASPKDGAKDSQQASLEILSMADPLPSDIIARLRSDSTAALAASLILAGSFPDIVSWALKAFSKSGEPKASVPAHRDDESRPAPRQGMSQMAESAPTRVASGRTGVGA